MLETLVHPENIEQIEKVNLILHDAHVQLYRFWKSQILFSWHWWIDLALTILPWIFWLIVKKKDSTHRLLHGGFVVIILTSILDNIGMAFGLWGYNYIIIPLIPPYIPWDFTLFPVTAMLFFQYKTKINPFVKAVVFSALGSFIVQPLFQWLGFYNPKEWKHYYSFPIVIIIYLIAHFFTTRKSFEKI